MEDAAKKISTKNISIDHYHREVAAVKLEHSYIGYMGKAIEPVIRPLGYDWKIGISLITSFAAREVFVGSLATIYAVHQEDDNAVPLIERLRDEKNAKGKPVYNLASGVSLMVFYAFAMQCMATLAVVKRETKSWKWPLIQLGYMGSFGLPWSIHYLSNLELMQEIAAIGCLIGASVYLILFFYKKNKRKKACDKCS